MSSERLRDLMRVAAAQDGPPPRLDAVVASTRRRWRVRPARASLAAACLVAVAIVALEARPRPTPELAELVLPPTTDWLLETPGRDRRTDASHTETVEKPHAP
jgi:hypothetical protein